MRDLLTRVLFWLFDKGIASRGIRLPNRVVISAYAGLGSSLEDQRPRSVSRRFPALGPQTSASQIGSDDHPSGGRNEGS